jgi:BASS family bile acid:Na+ symporter
MTAEQLFNAIFNASVVVMVLTLVTGLGLSLSPQQIVAPLARVPVLVGAVIANSIVIPLLAIGVCNLLPLASEARVGVELAAMAAGGPVGMKAAELSKRSDLAMALSFTIVLQIINIVAAPLWATQIVSGATVDPMTIVTDLLVLVLAPLVVGQVLRARHGDHAASWQAGLEKVSNAALLVAIVIGLAVNWSLVIGAFGTWVIAASVVIAIGCVVVGWLGGRVGGSEAALTVAFVSGMRFTPIGLIVIATLLNNEGAYLIPALIFSLACTLVPIVIGLEVGRAAAKAVKPQPADVPLAVGGQS